MPPRGQYSDVVRVVRGVRGKVAMRMELAIRFDYGRTIPWVTSRGDEWQGVAGPDRVVLRTKAKLRGEGMTTVSEFTVGAREVMTFVLTYGSSLEKVPKRINAGKALADTRRFWRGMDTTECVSRAVCGCSGALADYAEGADVSAFGWNCCCAYDFATGEDRRGA
jgi:hypothetical protein